MRRALIFAALAASVSCLADEQPFAAAPVVTNVVIRSNQVETKAWRRDVPSVRDGSLVDASGVLADKLDAEAVDYVAEHAGEVSDAAVTGSVAAVHALFAATNGMPQRCEGISLQFMRKSPANLMGHVIDEYYEGGFDYQYVRLTKYISEPPKRQIVYTYPGGSSSAECEWLNWSPAGIKRNGYGGVHLCRAKRPTALVGASCLTYVKDVFGGDNGFDFGSMTVFVDGSQTVTGVYTTRVSQAVIEIKNGVITSWK